MKRTAEQQQADEALTAAIDGVRRAYYDKEAEFLLTEYVVLANSVCWRGDERFTATEIVYRDGDIPMVHALGLIQFANVRIKKLIAEDDEED